MKKKEIALLEQGRVIRKEELLEHDKLVAMCDHTKENRGKIVSALLPVDREGLVAKCSICDATVDFTEEDVAELKEAVATVANAIQCIKSVANLPKSLRALYGDVLLSLDRLPNLYQVMVLDKIDDDRFDNSMTPTGINPIGMNNSPYLYQAQNTVLNSAFAAQMYGGGGYAAYPKQGKKDKHGKKDKNQKNGKKKNKNKNALFTYL